MTGYRDGIIMMYVKDSPNLPFLFDPVTQSVVYYPKSIPLYQQASTFYQIVKRKYDNKEKAIIEASRD